MSIDFPENGRRPTLRIELPKTTEWLTLSVTNSTVARSLSLILSGWAGGDLILDFYRRTITDQTGADLSSALDPLDEALWSSGAPLILGINNVAITVSRLFDTGFKTAPFEGQSDGGEGATKWSTASGNWTATFTVGGQSNKLKFTKLGFALPAGAVLKALEARIVVSQSGGTGIQMSELGLIKEGAAEKSLIRPRPQFPFWPAVETRLEIGAEEAGSQPPVEAKVWGLGMTAAQINKTTSGFYIAVDTAQASVAKIGIVDARCLYTAKAAIAAKATWEWEKGVY